MQGRETREGDGQSQTTENVVRLPRDWLGPRDELVPIGSRADALDQDSATTSPLPPGASSFWDEDSGSIQAAMQAPEGDWRSAGDPVGPSTDHVRRRRVPRIHAPWSAPEDGGGRRRTILALGSAAACLIAVLAVIGLSEGPASSTGKRAASVTKSGKSLNSRGVHPARSKPLTPKVTQVRPEPRSRHATNPHHGATHIRRRQRVSTTRHRRHALSSSTATSQSPPTTTPTSTAAPETTPSPTPPASSGSTGAAASSSGGRQPAFGPTGSLGPGSSPDS
jgi:hypothetical protein